MANETTGRESDKFMLRMPDGMRDRIAEAARANNRSMNAEIVSRLQQSLDAPGTRPVSDVLTPEGLSLMRSYAAETKQTLQELLAALDKAEAVLLPEDARERTTPKPD